MTNLKCLKCGSISVTVNDHITHLSIHKRTHRPAMPFLIWLGRYLETFMTEKMFVQIETEILLAYHEIYTEYLSDTCRNTPCDYCMKKQWLYEMPQKKYMKYKLETTGKYEPRTFGTDNKKSVSNVLSRNTNTEEVLA